MGSAATPVESRPVRGDDRESRARERVRRNCIMMRKMRLSGGEEAGRKGERVYSSSRRRGHYIPAEITKLIGSLIAGRQTSE